MFKVVDIRKQFYFAFLVLFSVCLPFQGAYSKVVEVEGSAVITDGAINKARLTAIQDAIRQAILQTSVRVTTSSIVSANVMIMDSTKVRATGRVSNVVVIDEWHTDEEIHVLIRAEVPENTMSETSKPEGYRRKLAMVQFHVTNRRSIQDLANIEIEYPRRLLRRIEEYGGVIGVDATNYVLNNVSGGFEQITARPDKDTIIKLAETLGVQFVVSGILRDMAVADHLTGDSRQLSIDVQIFDGISGILLSQYSSNEHVKDAGLMESDIAFGSQEFFQTNFGKVLDTVLTQQVSAVQSSLNRLPITVRVVRTEGKKIYFDAGATSLVRVGDMLMAYKVDDTPLVKASGSINYGFPEKPVATLTVRKIQPLFAMGELETDQVALKPGDLLRFGW